MSEFKKFIPTISRYGVSLIPTLSVPVKSLYHSLKSNTDAQSVIILIGPEGDFSKNEVGEALSFGAHAVTLGDLVMRSETAAVFSLSVARFFYREIAQQS